MEVIVRGRGRQILILGFDGGIPLESFFNLKFLSSWLELLNLLVPIFHVKLLVKSPLLRENLTWWS